MKGVKKPPRKPAQPLVFAGIPLAVVGIVFGAVFSTTPKPPRDESKKTKKP